MSVILVSYFNIESNSCYKVLSILVWDIILFWIYYNFDHNTKTSLRLCIIKFVFGTLITRNKIRHLLHVMWSLFNCSIYIRWTPIIARTVWRTCHHRRRGWRRIAAVVALPVPVVSIHCRLERPSPGTPRGVMASLQRRCTIYRVSTVAGPRGMWAYQISQWVSYLPLFVELALSQLIPDLKYNLYGLWSQFGK